MTGEKLQKTPRTASDWKLTADHHRVNLTIARPTKPLIYISAPIMSTPSASSYSVSSIASGGNGRNYFTGSTIKAIQSSTDIKYH